MNEAEEKFKAFLEGLEMKNIEDFMKKDINFISDTAIKMASITKSRRNVLKQYVPPKIWKS